MAIGKMINRRIASVLLASIVIICSIFPSAAKAQSTRDIQVCVTFNHIEGGIGLDNNSDPDLFGEVEFGFQKPEKVSVGKKDAQWVNTSYLSPNWVICRGSRQLVDHELSVSIRVIDYDPNSGDDWADLSIRSGRYGRDLFMVLKVDRNGVCTAAVDATPMDSCSFTATARGDEGSRATTLNYTVETSIW